MKVKECMAKNVYCLKPENTVQDCAKLMSDNHIGCIPICDSSNSIVGLVTDRDVILRTIACNKDAKTTPISEIMTNNVCYCNFNTDVVEAQELMYKNQIRRLPVVDDSNKIIGIVTLGDFAKNNNIGEVAYTLNGICKCNKKNAE